MDFLDDVLPTFVDYLGSFDANGTSIRSPPDVMFELLERGVHPQLFFANAEMICSRDNIIISADGVKKIQIDMRRVEDPVAFKRRNHQPEDGFSKVVVFKELRNAHYKGYDTFHAVQCLDVDPSEVVEIIRKNLEDFELEDRISDSPSRSLGVPRKISQISQGSLDNNWLLHTNSFGKNVPMNPTDSVRSATISRRNNTRPRSSMVFGSEPGTPMPVPPPTPPAGTKWQSRRQNQPLPLVIDQAKTAETLGFEKPNFVYATTESRKEKNIILLNYAIGDIEKFRENVAQVRAGLGSRDFRATDFFGIFQKFKLAINLLGRLDGQIENPSTEDVLHHMIPHLSYLVDEAFELFQQDIVREVSTPMLTGKALDFINRVLIAGEIMFWEGLGDHWNIPRTGWEGETIPFSPRFSDGWTPGAISFFEDDEFDLGDEDEEPALKGVLKSPKVSKGHEQDMFQNFRRNSITSMTPSIMQDNYRDELIDRHAKIALVVYPRTAQATKELTVVKGEYLEVLDSSKNWWLVVNTENKSGYVPCAVLKKFALEEAAPDEVRKPIERKPSAKREPIKKISTSTSSDSGDSQFMRHSSALAPAPPPPPPPQPIAYTPKITKKERKSNPNLDTVRSQSVQEELRSVLEIFNKRDKSLDIIRTPNVYITGNSTPKDVQRWLKDKQFSKRVHDELFAVDGKKLFSMSKKELIEAFGKKEGTRLDAQITISRSMSNYTTGKSSELRKVLARHRERIERTDGVSDVDSDDDQDYGGRNGRSHV